MTVLTKEVQDAEAEVADGDTFIAALPVNLKLLLIFRFYHTLTKLELLIAVTYHTEKEDLFFFWIRNSKNDQL